MNRNSFDALLRFLSGRAKSAALLTVGLKELVPLIEKGRPGSHWLASHRDIDKDAAARAIAEATGAAAARIVFVSSSLPLPKPAWMSPAGLERAVAAGLKESLRVSLAQRLESRHGLDLRGAFSIGGPALRQIEQLIASLAGKIFRLSLDQILSDPLGAAMVDSLRAGLVYYLAFAMAGDAAKTDSLVPLIRLFRQAVPLGEMAGSPGTWLLLVD